MPFIWTDKPNPPSTDLPIPVPPGEITYEEKLVANLVNAGGTLSYNTPNVAFDIVYEFTTANVNVANFTNVSFNNITVNTANITTASINVANITTANILSANILYGFVSNEPTSNLQIASKHYVDAAAANVPSGGSDLQNLIDAKGDLLVGTGVHTAARLPVGSNDQILISDSTANNGLRWITVVGQEVFYNLWIQSHYDLASNDHVVLLRYAGEIIMQDGTRTVNWLNKTADIELSGAGGLDQGVEEANTWYEVHAIRNSSNNDTALILHKAQQTRLDQFANNVTENPRDLRKATATNPKLAQSFIPALSGPLTSVELEASKTGSPTGLIWVTLESDNVGFPSGTILATSRVMDVSRLPTDKARMRFLFDTNVSVTLGSTYHMIYQGDYTLSDTNYTTLWGISTNPYANGRAMEFHTSSGEWHPCTTVSSGPDDFFFKTFVKSSMQTPVVMPSGYDQRCLISYVCNNRNGKFKPYTQKDRTQVYSVCADWRCLTTLTGLIESVDLNEFMAPVLGSVQFYYKLNPTVQANNRNVHIGGVACTDLPIASVETTGQMTANTTAGDILDIASATYWGVIVVEEQTILTRMQNTGANIYSTMLIF